MRIGFDFDNTIVSYDKLFYQIAREQGVVPASLPINKQAVRDYLRQANQEPIWTQMQGYVYGARMLEAEAFPAVMEVMKNLHDAKHELFIISHKTKHPYLGVQYDLHEAARNWIDKNLVQQGERLLPHEQIYFELTKEAKIARIHALACDVFLDDLPEILLLPGFPEKTKRLLFDPEKVHLAENFPNLKIISSWQHLESYL